MKHIIKQTPVLSLNKVNLIFNDFKQKIYFASIMKIKAQALMQINKVSQINFAN